MKGYEAIGKRGQEIFIKAHTNHLMAMGNEARKDYELANIKKVKANNAEQVIEVYFMNGELVKYKPNGEWY